MVTKREVEEENKELRSRLRDCLDLIEELSNLDRPLFEADLPRSFKLKYVRTISRAKKTLGNK